MFEHFYWQALSVLCQPADAIADCFFKNASVTAMAGGKHKGKIKGRGKSGLHSDHGLCETIRAAPSMQRFRIA